MKMKRLLIIFIVVFLSAGSRVFASLSFAPSWRGAEGSTYQEWSFSDANTTPSPDIVDNPYGDPQLRVTPLGDWISGSGAWPLSGEIDVYIPNRREPLPEKWIWLQLIWQAGGNDPDIFLPDSPVVGVTSDPLFAFMQMSRTDTVDFIPGWTHSLYVISLYPNPIEEWITIKGDILVDYVAIDTICIPEPATITLLGIAGLTILTRKRQVV